MEALRGLPNALKAKTSSSYPPIYSLKFIIGAGRDKSASTALSVNIWLTCLLIESTIGACLPERELNL
jgi:hypothetical protein